MPVLTLRFHSSGRSETRAVEARRLVIAGWTGRDRDAVEKHIRELEELGVRRPASVPIFYRASVARLTQADAIEAIGTASSGEVEFMLLREGGRIWVGVGSDHTDREVETYNVTVSKQMCDKPIASEAWAFDDVLPHWDRLVLRSWIEENGARTLYQEGSVAAMIAPRDLMALAGDELFADNTAMFCGTLAAKGGIRPSSRFEFEIEDPVLGRRISHAYVVRSLLNMG